MNNQVKLIDETKLLKAVFEEKSRHERARDRLEIDHKYWEFHEGSVTTLEWLEKKIEKGMFAPDTTPVPTIKPGDKGYKCSACRESSTSAEWNMETGAYLGIAMHFINLYGKDSDTFVCPKCGEEQPRHMVEVVE